MEEDLSPNEDVSVWDIYGKTPPRTKILRKNRERKQKCMSTDTVSKSQKSRHLLMRRNTVSTMYDELIAKADKSDFEQGHGSKRTNKRHMKLLRGSERDLKLDIASAQASAHVPKRQSQGFGPHGQGPNTPLPSYQIESCKRFMSLVCRTIPCHKQSLENTDTKIVSTNSSNNDKPVQNNEIVSSQCPQSRVEFFQTLSMLIRMGCGKDERIPRRGMSREESLWQNELKDLIWLELQAFHADRTPMEEDEYLCSARQSVEPLLQTIMTYRFQRHSRKYNSINSQNSDSGLEDDCPGCDSVYCVNCMEAQNEALKEIESLMKRLEDVEALFPSSKAFAELYPLYNDPNFVSRVKCISLWFNMTKIQRLKLNILARLVLCLESKHENWPVLCDEVSSGSSSDSNNSSASSTGGDSCINRNDMYNVMPLAMLISKKDEKNVSPYRRYIENILKTRALYKSLNFLESLHNNVLYKAHLTLEKPLNREDIFSKVQCDTQEEELIRFGIWSPEAKNIDLPSYRSMFLFLAGVPLEVIKEYLQMRLEQKPEKPSPLSVRQLMRELKEGLKIAAIERERIEKYIAAVESSTDKVPECHKELMETFNKCMVKVFKDYLEYLEQWVLFHHNTFKKTLLEEEFHFSLTVVKYIEDGYKLLGNKYANILGSILERIADRLLKRIDEYMQEIRKDDVNTLKQTLFAICREFQTLFNDEREMSMKTMAFTRMIFTKSGKDMEAEEQKFLLNSIIAFKCIIPTAIAKVQSLFDYITVDFLDDMDKAALTSRIREIMMQIYRFGFEFYKEMTEGISSEYRHKLVYSMVHFAKLWMSFVTERCERGRGMRPRWANQGMEFLLTVCEPANTKFLTEHEFEDLKKSMDDCISHLIGTTAPSTPESGFYSASPRMSLEHIRIRSRGSSPSPRATYKSPRSAPIRKTSVEQQSPSGDALDNLSINFNLCPSIKKEDKMTGAGIIIKLPPKTYTERIRDAIESLESKMDEKLRKEQLIGKCLACNTEQKNHVRRRNVTFSWQRGIKIGQGRFGKVYTAVNNTTGEMMAVKEIPIQHNDSLTIKRLSEEVKILEGISDDNLVKYYGVEVYTDKMLLFMEFCAEGTLESLINATENGLPELLVRKYTYQLLCGVACLHDHGIVHRDIKPANIFLTQEGNCLKIGDFGCAAKIKSNITMPGELKGFVGTQAYMAPEVFTKNMNEGHGRAADIWSVGCVVVEMASGKRPWAQYDSNYQIMFKVGMGQSPDPPDDMIDEGLDFLELCFKHNPKERCTAHELLAHNFVKVGDDLI